MTDLRGLAQRESGTSPSTDVSLEQIASRIGMVVGPYAFSLGIDPAVSSALVRFAALAAAGIVRELQIEHIRAQAVVVRDERT